MAADMVLRTYTHVHTYIALWQTECRSYVPFSMVTLLYALSGSCKLEIHLGENCWMCHFSHCLESNTTSTDKSIYI